MKFFFQIGVITAGFCAAMSLQGCRSPDGKQAEDASAIKSFDFASANYTAMDLAMVFPARTPEEIGRLLKLDSRPADLGVTPFAPNGAASRGLGEILSRSRFDAFLAKGGPVLGDNSVGIVVPPYERWRIVSIRPLLCARVKNAHTLPTSSWPENCQVEHRLVAQPLNEAGTAFEEFAIHIISRPFSPGSQSLPLASAIATEVARLKNLAGNSIDSNGAGFGIYPAMLANPEMVTEANKYVLRFYGDRYLRTLAFMGSVNAKTWLMFSGSSSQNTPLSRLIRPNDSAAFEIVKDQGSERKVEFRNTNGASLGAPSGNLGSHNPNLGRLLNGDTSTQALRDAASIENITQTILTDTDCVSCHQVSGTTNASNQRAAVDGQAEAFTPPAGVFQKIAAGAAQDKKTQFVNLGYSGSRPSISLEAAHDAAQQAMFANRFNNILVNVDAATANALQSSNVQPVFENDQDVAHADHTVP